MTDALWRALPQTVSEALGCIAFLLHILAFVIYGRQVLSSRIRANVATWLMWLFGGIVDWLTYKSIDGAHWSTSALPFADVLGVAVVCGAILVAQRKARGNTAGIVYHRPDKGDYYLVGFDVIALGVWGAGWGAALANDISVGTTILQFIPIWKTTYRDPDGESALPWLFWSIGYVLMLGALVSGDGRGNPELYFLPAYYLALHLVVLYLALRCRSR